MKIFVGAEYVIANALIAMNKKHQVTEIAVSKLHDFGITIQRYCLENEIEAIFLLSCDRVDAAIYNFSDYFSLKTKDGIEYICINRPIGELEERFVGYLPLDVIDALLEQAEAFV